VSPQRGPVLPYKIVAGVTPVRHKWLVASAKMAGSTFAPEEANLYDSFREVVDMRPALSALVVNAPIGYRSTRQEPQRQCDVEVRAMLGRRGVTIRRSPTRGVISRGKALPSDHLDAVTLTLLPVVLEVASDLRGVARTEFLFLERRGAASMVQVARRRTPGTSSAPLGQSSRDRAHHRCLDSWSQFPSPPRRGSPSHVRSPSSISRR
jgi:hypothetical protein